MNAPQPGSILQFLNLEILGLLCFAPSVYSLSYLLCAIPLPCVPRAEYFTGRVAAGHLSGLLSNSSCESFCNGQSSGRENGRGKNIGSRSSNALPALRASANNCCASGLTSCGGGGSTTTSSNSYRSSSGRENERERSTGRRDHYSVLAYRQTPPFLLLFLVFVSSRATF